MSTKTTPYHEKVQQGNRMYGPCPKIPEYPYHLDAEQIRNKYGDSTPYVTAGVDEFGEPIKKRRSMT